MSDLNATTEAPQTEYKPKQSGLSTFLKVSIVLLAGLTVASISLLFIGDFDGKFERVFSTFALFAIFVVFTAIDTRISPKSEWYAPVALIANAYVLALLLAVIWVTPYTSYGLLFEIFVRSVFVLFVVRLVILCCQLLLLSGARLPELVTRFAFVTSVLAVLSGILFTAPIGLEVFDLRTPDLYWKISVAVLILAALGLSITLLLRWTFGAEQREAVRAERAARLQAAAYASYGQYPVAGAPVRDPYGQYQAPLAQYPAPGVAQPGVPAPAASAAPFQAAPTPAAQQPQTAVQPTAPAAPMPIPSPESAMPAPPQPAMPAPAMPSAAAQEPELLPWPTFDDGTPLPAGPDGQPDFSVLPPR